MTALTATWHQLEYCSSAHDKAYIVLDIPGLAQVVCAWGRRGALSPSTKFSQVSAEDTVYGRRRRGYELRWTAELSFNSTARTHRALWDAAHAALRAQAGTALARLSPTDDADTVVALRGLAHAAMSRPLAAEVLRRLHGYPAAGPSVPFAGPPARVFEARSRDVTVALVPEGLARLAASLVESARVPAEPGDEHALSVAAGLLREQVTPAALTAQLRLARLAVC